MRLGPVYGDLDREIDRFFNRQRQKRQPVQFRGPTWHPAVDLFETADMMVALVELAGVDLSALDIIVEDRGLIIRGRRDVVTEHQARSYHIMEISDGPFERAIPLPASVNADGTKADIKNGILQVCMPKAPALQITITVRDQSHGG